MISPHAYRWTAASIWLVIALVYWWTHPTPTTQVSFAGITIPPIPGHWVFLPYSGEIELLYLGLVLSMAPFYWWLGPPGKGGSHLSITCIHAVFATLALAFGGFPVRAQWAIDVTAWVYDDAPFQDWTEEKGTGILALFFLSIAAMFVVAQLRHKLEFTEDPNGLRGENGPPFP